MSAATDTPAAGPSTPVLLVLLVLGLAILGGVSYLLSIADRREESSEQAIRRIDMSGPVVSIVLPSDDPVLPPGPHSEVFHRQCGACHSTRLILTQPPLKSKQWEAVVRKMITVYKAPVTADDEKQVVAYLTTAFRSEQP